VYAYHACGVTFESQLELPGIPRANTQQVPSVRLYFGDVPESLEDPAGRGAAYDAAPGRLLLRSPAGRYLVRDGREIIIQPKPETPESEIRIFLMGSAFGALLHQRGVLPLHASTVQVGDGCVAFAGISGSGKSTLAAFLHQKGYPLVGDDICPVRFLPGVGAVALPGFRRFKLWADSMIALGWDAADYPQPRTQLEKYEVTAGNVVTERLFPLRRLYLLSETRDRDPVGIHPVEGPDRLKALLGNTYRFGYLDGFGLKTDHFKICMGVLSSTDVFRLWRPLDLSKMAEPITWLEEHWRDLGDTAGQKDRFAPLHDVA